MSIGLEVITPLIAALLTFALNTWHEKHKKPNICLNVSIVEGTTDILELIKYEIILKNRLSTTLDRSGFVLPDGEIYFNRYECLFRINRILSPEDPKEIYKQSLEPTALYLMRKGYRNKVSIKGVIEDKAGRIYQSNNSITLDLDRYERHFLDKLSSKNL